MHPGLPALPDPARFVQKLPALALVYSEHFMQKKDF
jgi:hypothetical protein